MGGYGPGITWWWGYYPGARAEHVIPIYNGTDRELQVDLLFELPSEGDGEYTIPPDYVRDWVTFEEESPVIPANSMREILVVLQMPKDAEVFAEKWEFRVTVVPAGQGQVQTAVSQRWLITMR